MDFMRTELLQQYRGVHLWLRGADGHKIDAVLLPPQQQQRHQPPAQPTGPPAAGRRQSLGGPALDYTDQAAASRSITPSSVSDDEGHELLLPVTAAAALGGTGTGGPPAINHAGGAHLGGPTLPSWLAACWGSGRRLFVHPDEDVPLAFSTTSDAASSRSGASASNGFSIAESDARAIASSAQAVVLMCGPNAGLYEYAHRQSEAVDLYTSNGMAVLLWNYRYRARACPYHVTTH
jgi:hypothetical protein